MPFAKVPDSLGRTTGLRRVGASWNSAGGNFGARSARGGLPHICAMARDFARAAMLTWRRTAAIMEGNVAMAAAEKMGGRFLTA